jgi:cell division septal protein FtsQ
MKPPRRQVRRSGLRPTYSRRQATRRTISLPMPRISWLRVIAPLVGVVIVLILIANLTALTTIRVKGERQLTVQHITSLTQSSLHQQWFGHNLILVNTGAVEANLLKVEPAIRQVSVSRHWFHSLVVTIQERQPTLNWKTSGTSYLLDANAIVIAPTIPAYAQLPTVTDSSNLPVKIGEQVAPSSFASFCSSLAQLLPTIGYPVTAMTVPATTSEVYVQTKGGLLLKFDTTRPAGEEVNDLKQVTAQLAAANQTATQYIDLRIEHKAYYQ